MTTSSPYTGVMGLQTRTSRLSQDLLADLWTRITERLRQGEPLITLGQFQFAMEKEYELLTGEETDPGIRTHIRRVVTAVNTRHPETYVAQGMQNGVNQAFDKGVGKLRWDEAKIQAKGARSIQRFSRQENVDNLLKEVNVRRGQIDILGCLQHSLEVLKETRVPLQPPDVAPLSKSVTSQPPKPLADVDPLKNDPDIQAAVDGGDVGKDEARRRLEQQERSGSVLEKRELEKVTQNLQSYVAQGTITEEEAEKLGELSQVDARLKRGEIDEKKATQIRNSILHGDVRDTLNRQIQDAVDQAVRYLQVFESMQKIGLPCDAALEFLIAHKEVVTATEPQGVDLVQVIQELTDDASLLQGVVDIMERQDHEIRMISVRLPPYNYIMKHGLEKIGNMTIESSFLEELRNLDTDQVSERLNALDMELRVRPAADMRCLISLVDHATKRTRFRKEVRMVRISQEIEEFFRSTSNLEEARSQAEGLLNRRMRRLFRDMPEEELAELKERGAGMIDSIEQKIIEERQAEAEAAAQRQQEEEPSRKLPQSEAAEDDLELTEEESQLGVQIGRVEVRVAGRYRQRPYKILPDPDDPERFVVATWDRETGELKPQLRGGNKRYVRKGKGGIWRPE